MASISTLRVGQTVYTVMTEPSLDGTKGKRSVAKIKVLDIQKENSIVVASVNDGPAETFTQKSVSKWKRSRAD